MKVLVTGASGLVGSELVPFLAKQGHEVYRLTHSKPHEATDIAWDPMRNQIPKGRIDGVDVVIHLAGENIAGKRWTDAYKQLLRQSRVDVTKLLCETLAKLDHPPKTLICASAVGFYGDRGGDWLNETSAPGAGFLPDLCRDWEAACQPARDCGIRVANLRTGVVLSAKGGALAKMLTPFKLGTGGVLGTGNQYMSWISIDDMLGAIDYCINHETLTGPINLTTPCPVTNYDFTKTLGTVLGRPTIVPLPALAVSLIFGEMGNALLLASARVMPNRLCESGYQFLYPTIEPALKHLLAPAKAH